MFILDDLPSLFFEVSDEPMMKSKTSVRFKKFYLLPTSNFLSSMDEENYEFDAVSQAIKKSFVNCEADGLNINVVLNALANRFSVYDLLFMPQKAN